MPGRSGLEERLQVAVGPLAQRALTLHDASSVEGLAQVGDELLPLIVREFALEGAAEDGRRRPVCCASVARSQMAATSASLNRRVLID